MIKQTGKVAIAGGKPVRESFLPFSIPFIDREEEIEIIDTLRSGWISTGPRTMQFEKDICTYLGAKHAVALNSCTAGLHVALVAAGIGNGDEVITSPFTFPSTANVILQQGAQPVFVDIRGDTYNIDPAKIRSFITDRTKAIIPVHYGGQPCDMDKIMKIARETNLFVIEDAATAIGAQINEKYLGGMKDSIAIFSFYANKVMTTGEGGVLTTDNDDIAEKIRRLSLHGISRDAWKRYSKSGSWYFEVLDQGFKYNMSDLQAALGLCQLRRLEWFIERREGICIKYDMAFSQMEEIITPYISPRVRSSRYIYPIQLREDRLSINRDKFITELKAENIGSSVHYIPVHLHPYYQKKFRYSRGDYPVTESVYDRIVSLPLFPAMTDRDVNDVIHAVKKIIHNSKSFRS